jgi:exodeoxyribonuclease VII large subunit
LVQLEKLKAELRGRGWFDRKRPLPSFPRVIGVVTSRDGAAFQDFLRTRSLRWPSYPVRLRHTIVQGAGAALEIARAIAALDASGVDVIVVCRGGGSLEDLWAFNELPVAEALWNASVPVITGVGHEVDVTLADLVADVRAHTPTDAAQRVIPDLRALLEGLERQRDHLEQAIDEALTRRGEALERIERSRVLRDARWILDERRERLRRGDRDLARAARALADGAAARLELAGRKLDRAGPAAQVARRETRLAVARSRLAPAAERVVQRVAERTASFERQLDALSPLRVLERGYSITLRSGATAPLVGTQALHAGDELDTIFHRGRARSRVTALDANGSDRPAPSA